MGRISLLSSLFSNPNVGLWGAGPDELKLTHPVSLVRNKDAWHKLRSQLRDCAPKLSSGPGDDNYVLDYPFLDPAWRYRLNDEFLQEIAKANVYMYTFGAPRVACDQFAKTFDKVAPHSFRVVNKEDIVARIPR